MTSRQFAAMLIRLLALYTGFQALLFASSAIASAVYLTKSNSEQIVGFDSTLLVVQALMPAIVYIAAAACFWFRADAIARRLAPDENAEKPFTESSMPLVQIGILLMGIWLVASHAPGILQMSVEYLAKKQTESFRANWVADNLPRAIANLTQIAIGLWMALGVQGISRALTALRNTGNDPEMMHEKELRNQVSS